MNVLDLTSDETYLYAATDEGIYRARIDAPNLQDYSNWQKQSAVPHADGSFSQIENFAGKITACYVPVSGRNEIYQFDGSSWNRVYTEIEKVFDMSVAFNDRIIISNEGDVYIFDSQCLLPAADSHEYDCLPQSVRQREPGGHCGAGCCCHDYQHGGGSGVL